MTWYLTKIPKIAHLFWDGKPLSFLRWASIRSFCVLNPDWDIRLHMTGDDAPARWSSSENKRGELVADYRESLADIPGLQIVRETAFGGMHGVHQSDILRTRYLSEDGGVWSDVDIIYHKPMDALRCNAEEFADRECALCWTDRWFPIAFMFGAQGSEFFSTVHQAQRSGIRGRNTHNDYQRYGTRVFSGVFKGKDYQPIPIDPEEVYQAHWRQHSRIFKGEMNIDMGIGIHWYGGSPSAAQFEPIITHENWREHSIRNLLEVTL